jgi:uncharacterized protein YicC (UPF0701 family)
LVENQKDIGNIIARIYGKDEGKRITKLLTKRVKILVKLVAAVKSCSKEVQDREIARLYANA